MCCFGKTTCHVKCMCCKWRLPQTVSGFSSQGLRQAVMWRLTLPHVMEQGWLFWFSAACRKLIFGNLRAREATLLELACS